MTYELKRHFQTNVIKEILDLKSRLILTNDEILALQERAFYYRNKHLFKRCRLCGKIKPLSAFYKNPLKKQGVFDECKECLKKRKQEKKKCQGN